jgi:hypothetical protein
METDLLTRLGGKEWLLFLGFSDVYETSSKDLVLVTWNKGSITISKAYCFIVIYEPFGGDMDCITTYSIGPLLDFIKFHTSIDLEAFSW